MSVGDIANSTAMLFRTNVFVLRAVRDTRMNLPGNDAWHDTVSYTFGINARDAAEAAAIAVKASESALGRDGDFVGGVVLEVQPKCVGREEFDGCEKYLMQPLDEPGIFYVSGITYTSIALHKANGATESLARFREWIDKNGIPAPSFIHPPLDDSGEPKTIRIVCPVCERWVEVDRAGLLYSFFDGLDRFSEECKSGQQAVQTAGPFVKSHFACLKDSAEATALIFLYEDDERYNLLDASKRT
jgi:hypothetical protein